MSLQQHAWLRDTSLNLKLLISPAILIVALGLVSLLAVYGLDEQRTALDTVRDISFERTVLINEFIAAGEQIQADLFQLSVLHFMDLSPEEIQPVRQNLERNLSDLKVIYGEILTRWPLDKTEQTLLEQMAAPLHTFHRQAEQAAAIVAENPTFGVLLVRSSTLPFAKLHTAQQEFLAYQQASFVRAEAQAHQRAARIRLAIIVVAFLVAVGGVLTTTTISTRLISQPIQTITNLMGRLAQGDLAVTIGAQDRQDEIGAMARAVEVFRHNAIQKAQAEQALRERQANLTALIENTDSRIWSVDRNYCFIAGNSVVRQNISRVLGRPLAVGDTVLSDGCVSFESN